MGEDQHAAGPRGLDEPEGGDRLAGAGRVLEPEALGGVGVLRLLLELAPRRRRRSSCQSWGSSSSGSSSSTVARRRARRRRSRRRRVVVFVVDVGVESAPSASAVPVAVPAPFVAAALLALLALPLDDELPLRRRCRPTRRCRPWLRCRCRCAGHRPSAPSGFPTARRPGEPRARFRRRGAVNETAQQALPHPGPQREHARDRSEEPPTIEPSVTQPHRKRPLRPFGAGEVGEEQQVGAGGGAGDRRLAGPAEGFDGRRFRARR